MTTFTGTNGSNIMPSLLGALAALGDDQFFGLGGNDLMIGFLGNDTFEGGAGADIIIGGVLDINLLSATVNAAGNDTATYTTSNAGVTVDLSTAPPLSLNLLNTGISLSVVEAVIGHGGHAEGDILIGITNLTGSNFADALTGNGHDNLLAGGGGMDTLSGNAGNDSIFGNTGDDLLFGGDGDDSMEGGDGVDTVNGGNGDDVLFGKDGADIINGDAGNDMLYGGTGADILTGGTGDDVYYIDAVGDTIVENVGQGIDGIQSTISVQMAAFSQNIENLELLDDGGNINATGNNLGNRIVGNIGNNFIHGGIGNDVLYGGRGNDHVFGDSGNDFLNAGIGNDTLTGGGGDDTLLGSSGGDTFVFAGVFGDDVVQDFAVAHAKEYIDLRAMSGVTGWADLTANHLSTNLDGDAVITIGANTITLTDVTVASLTANEFLF
ncbi:MAG: calcium-binding protein [Pseudomonadota bacterium]